jgi:inosine/xanthosine triphosphatase
MELTVAIGSTNKAKIDAVKEAFQHYPTLSSSRFAPFAVPSGVGEQPMTIEETLLGAKTRAKNAHDACRISQYSVGIESGLFPVPGTQTGFLNICICSIYNGKEHCIGLSSGFEVPQRILDLVREQKMDLSQACLHAGITDNAQIGVEEGLIGILTKGRIDRKEYTKQAIVTALVQLEHSQWYQL